MIQISNLIHRVADSPVGKFIVKQKAQDNVVGAVASAIFSRGTAVCFLGYQAYRFGRSLRSERYEGFRDNERGERVKTTFTTRGLLFRETPFRFAVSFVGALSFALAAIYTATRKTF